VKIVIAPDKFKENLTAEAVCEAMALGVRDVFPHAEIIVMPLADGGDGTARAITLAAGGQPRRVKVSGPLRGSVEAEFGLIRNGSVAVLDMASASGMALVPRDKLDPMKASTYGTGELIRAALDAGAREILLGIGGSATVDGGVGMALALGFDILDDSGQLVPLGGEGLRRVSRVGDKHADPRLPATKFVIACDVSNPLLGPSGAAAVFGPQKGASPADLPLLEAGLERLAEAWKEAGMASDVSHAGDGAAGGLGAALRIMLKAEMRSGALTVMGYSGFEAALEGADLVITGEGMTDSQTMGGKLCSVVASESRRLGVPVALLSGGLGGDVLAFRDSFDFAASTACGQIGLEAMMRDARRDLRFAAANLMRAWNLGAASAKGE
jgi:glycerate kinase